MTTVAGTGANGSDGDNGPAAAASFSVPMDVAVDHGTTLYIADSFAANIRKVDLTSGLITTLVCLGQSNLRPSSCSTARFMRAYPVALKLDIEGNVLFVDAASRQIKTLLSSTGEIITTAGNGLSGYADQGGTATNGVLNLPEGTAVSSDGYLFVADSGNGRVRRVNLSSGEISTIFDPANAPQISSVNSLSYPSHLALDELGNIYISDSEAYRVYRENLDNGIISIVAGGGIGGDGGPAVEAHLNSPQGIALDKKGHLFIAEYGSNRVRMVNLQTGIITTVAGSGERLYSGDGGPATETGIWPLDVAVDSNGDLFIADVAPYPGRVRRVAMDTGIISTVAGGGKGYPRDGLPATEAVLWYPTGLTLDSSDNLYIADSEDIVKVSMDTRIMHAFAGRGWFYYSGDGGPATNATLNYVFGLCADLDGTVYIADFYNNRVRRIRDIISNTQAETRPRRSGASRR